MKNRRFEHLQPYPFARLSSLVNNVEGNPAYEHIPLSLGEPKHAPPDFIVAALTDPEALAVDLTKYPATRGIEALRGSICQWLLNRFGAELDPETQVLPVNGTREALFSFAQALLSGDADSQVLMPNPFYQIYEGAALLGGATPVYLANDPDNGYQQDFSKITPEAWQKIELAYICSPGNPTGQVIPQAQLEELVRLALEHDFVIAADECYSEIYFDDAEPPGSLLNAALAVGNNSYKNCVVFHSLSKRSNLPGLRSGFVAGDAELMAPYFEYRTYHGSAMSPHHQNASALAWADEAHVRENRALYREKFATVETILAPVFEIRRPEGGFYHWLETPIDDTEFCRRLLAQYNVTVIPGRYLARSVNDTNPGINHVRVAWVSPLAQCSEAAERIKAFVSAL